MHCQRRFDRQKPMLFSLMKINITLLVAASLLLGGLILSREDSQNKTPSLSENDLLERFSIEKFDKKIVAPDFSLQDLNGRTVRLRDLRGKVVFLNFWATWCPSCKLEMPQMMELEKEFSELGLVILTVNFQEEAESVKEFFIQHHLAFTTVLDRRSEVFGMYQSWSLPTTYLISRNGEIEGKVVGYRDWHRDPARAFFRQLLESKT
jgi:peroxiredoxin